MGFSFVIFLQPGEYHKAADAFSRLPKESIGMTRGVAFVDNDISAYRTVGQISKPNTVSGEK